MELGWLVGSMVVLYGQHNLRTYLFRSGPGSLVGIATDYGLDGPGIESRWGRDFPPVQTGPGAHPASCMMGTCCCWHNFQVH